MPQASHGRRPLSPRDPSGLRMALIYGALLCAGLAVIVSLGPLSSAGARSPAIYWTADATQPIQDEWASLHTTAHCGTVTSAGLTDPRFYKVVDSTAPHGVAWRSTYVPSSATGCYCYPNVCREEAAEGNPDKTFAGDVDRIWHGGENVWISSEVKLDAYWPWSNHGTMVFQLTHPLDNGAPPWALAVEGRQWNVTGMDSNAYDTVRREMHLVGPIGPDLGKWVKFTFHMIMSSDPSQGAITVWSDLANPGGAMQEVYSRIPTFTLNTGPDGQPNWPAFLTFGFYTGASHDPRPMGMEAAGLTVASTRAAAQANAFAGSSMRRLHRRAHSPAWRRRHRPRCRATGRRLRLRCGTSARRLT